MDERNETALICIRYSFLSPHINNRKDVLESHVGDEDKQGAVDIHHAVLVHSLIEVHDADQQRNHLRHKLQTLSLFSLVFFRSLAAFAAFVHATIEGKRTMVCKRRTLMRIDPLITDSQDRQRTARNCSHQVAL